MGIAANVARGTCTAGSSATWRPLASRLSGRALLDDGDTERIDAAIDAARDAGRVRDALVVVPREQTLPLGLLADAGRLAADEGRWRSGLGRDCHGPAGACGPNYRASTRSTADG